VVCSQRNRFLNGMMTLLKDPIGERRLDSKIMYAIARRRDTIGLMLLLHIPTGRPMMVPWLLQVTRFPGTFVRSAWLEFGTTAVPRTLWTIEEAGLFFPGKVPGYEIISGYEPHQS